MPCITNYNNWTLFCTNLEQYGPNPSFNPSKACLFYNPNKPIQDNIQFLKDHPDGKFLYIQQIGSNIILQVIHQLEPITYIHPDTGKECQAIIGLKGMGCYPFTRFFEPEKIFQHNQDLTPALLNFNKPKVSSTRIGKRTMNWTTP
mmetsp:Transcript_21744/g.33178  ORF Transcript_21744/g.33178 Transcript_21744/m.33178 type:complete len:146 (+) Transcript_21744:98-535(+)